MTRQKWTTKEQEEWLQERRAAYVAANQERRAAQDFFPDVVKAFREKWPVPPPTAEEIKDAGSLEFAVRVQRDKYDKRTTQWFPNKTRALTSTAGARGVLKVKGAPRKLQAWQAYQALTYETMWKPHVDKAWAEYKAKWVLENPGVKPEKTRLEIMSVFMKEKYAEADDEMKATCEKYRVPETRDEVTPGPSKTKDAVNKEYQLAIDKLPRTLATIGESILNQAGWYMTIIAGGPDPSNGGAITSYISHTGKTKDGKNYKEFLGSKDYNEHIHCPFDAFLHACFTNEDCNDRKLMKKEGEDEKKGMLEATDDEEEVQIVEERTEDTDTPPQLSQYEVDRAKNIADLQLKLAQLKRDFPAPDDGNVQVEEGKGKGKGKGPRPNKKKEIPGERRVSQRLKETNVESIDTGSVIPPSDPTQNTVSSPKALPANIPVPQTPEVQAHANQADTQAQTVQLEGPITDVPVQTKVVVADVDPSNAEGDRDVAMTDIHQILDSDLATQTDDKDFQPPDAPTTTPDVPSSPECSKDTTIDEAQQVLDVQAEDRIPVDVNSVPSPLPSTDDVLASGTTSVVVDSVHPVPTDLSVPTSVTDNSQGPQPSQDLSASGVVSTNSEGLAAQPSQNLLPSVAATDNSRVPQQSKRPQNDADTPVWLSNMITTLRQASQDAAWQALLTEFVAFEKSGPPTGNLPTKHRPKEIADWIKSKKKDVVPRLNPTAYRDRFWAWWSNLQPAWRKEGESVPYVLLCDAPDDEKWQAIRKGGTAGIYVAVVGLSWWVRAQPVEDSTSLWMVVDDVLWVFQQLNKDSAPTVTLKRALDEDNTDESRATKSRRLSG